MLSRNTKPIISPVRDTFILHLKPNPTQTEPIMPTLRTSRTILALLAPCLALSLTLPAAAQRPTPQPADSADSDDSASDVTPGQTPAQLRDSAWQLLTGAAADPKHAQTRIQALAALGLLGANPRSIKLIETAMADPDVDVRSAAALAAGQTHARSLVPALRHLLADTEPQVAYTAALTLWRNGDRSGQNLLVAVVDGDRRSSPTLLDGTEHDINKTVHSPSTLAKIGITEGRGCSSAPSASASPPITTSPQNGGNSARATALEALAQDRPGSKTRSGALRQTFVSALDDKDPALRAAAARALAPYHTPGTAAAISNRFYDRKSPVRLNAAAAYLICSGASPASPHLDLSANP
jgi:hypothetical protein